MEDVELNGKFSDNHDALSLIIVEIVSINLHTIINQKSPTI